MLMKKTGSIALLACSITWSLVSLAENSPRVESAIELIKIGCVSGNSTNFEVSGDGSVSFLKQGVAGSVNFTSEEINGVIAGANDSLKAEQNSDIRKCMQQYIPKILDAILDVEDTTAPAENDNYYLSNQRIPLEVPVSILDGGPSVIIKKIYETNRTKKVDVYVEIPHRATHKLTMATRDRYVKSASEFEYRDIIYRLTVSHIDLQEQNITISLVKYKELK